MSGATGLFGGAAVALALAMGAGCVVAAGRNEQVLADLQKLGPRVRTAKLSGNEDEDRETMKKASPGPIDCVLDLLPPAAPPTVARAAIMAVRTNGRAILMGGKLFSFFFFFW